MVGVEPQSQRREDCIVRVDYVIPVSVMPSRGCRTLEALATLKRLVAAEKIPAPRRTRRFWWSTEIRSEKEYFKKHPEETRKILLAVSLDQAGGDRNAENNFEPIGEPDWLPSYSDDLIYALTEHMTDNYTPPEHEPSALVAADAGRPNRGAEALKRRA